MIRRCTSTKSDCYPKYGAVGVTVCKDWLESFDKFVGYMGLRPEDASLDRYPNPYGNYEPGNCRWATKKEQMRNRRNSVIATHEGKTQCLSAWIEEMGLQAKAETVRSRVRNGWTPKEALGIEPRTPEIKRMFVNFGGKEQHVNAWLTQFRQHQNEAKRLWPIGVKAV